MQIICKETKKIRIKHHKVMKRKITQWALTMAIAVTLVACATTSGRYASTSDDIYYSPTKTENASIVKNTETTIEDAEIKQLKSETQAAIIKSAKNLATETDSTIVVVEDAPYKSIVSESYEDSYERRLRGYESPSYGMESVIRITSSSDWMQVTSFDPAFYNIIVMGDEIWVEPKYITSMFSPVRTTINLGWNWGYGRYWDPWYLPRFGWFNSWYSWNYPYYGSYWGWNYGWNGYWGHGHWGHGHHHHNYYNPHWGLGRPSLSGGGTSYGRRTSGTMGQNRVSSTSVRTQDVNSGTRRATRNMELVSNRKSTNNTSTSVTAGNRRGNAVGNATSNNTVNQNNTTGRTRDMRGTVSDSRGQTNQNARRNSQVYTRPATASKQNYNESSTTSSGVSRRGSTTAGGSAARVSAGSSGSSNRGNATRSVSTSGYTNRESGNSNSGSSTSRRSSSNSSSSSVSRSSSSSSSSYSSPSSSSSRSSGSSMSSGGSRSGGSSSGGSSGGGGRRR
jgi:hypothetical protein